jgi:hypothetical protein
MKVSELERYLAKEMEGYVFADVGMVYFGGGMWNIMRDYYVVKNGVIYIIEDGKHTPSNDTFSNLNAQCIKIGKFNPKYKYKRSSKTYNYMQIKKLI